MSSATNLQHGFNGMKRITAADDPLEIDCYAIKAVSDDVTFGAGCVVPYGDAPAEGDPLLQSDVLDLRMTTVDLATGIAYVYPEEKLEE